MPFHNMKVTKQQKSKQAFPSILADDKKKKKQYFRTQKDKIITDETMSSTCTENNSYFQI